MVVQCRLWKLMASDIKATSHKEDLRWLSCVLDDGKMLLLATDRVILQEICRQIQQQLNS